MLGIKESAPSSLAYLYSSRRQTGLTTIYKERVRLYRRIPIPRGRSVHLVGDYLSTNLIRIFDTDLSPAKILQKQLYTSSFRHYNMDDNHYAIAKVQKVFGFTSGKREMFVLGQEKSPNTKLYQGWMGFVIYLFLFFF